ncbi:MAG: butyrate kinase [Alistipes sp.]|nr:butyrate kinase [Alistipes sp.]
MSYKVLTINPGSTSTKIALYGEQGELWNQTLRHPAEEIAHFGRIAEQFEWRLSLILEAMEARGESLSELSAVVGRGGLTKPVMGGTYEVTTALIDELRTTPMEHASNLGAPLADAIARKAGVKAYIVDPPTVDELQPTARVSGVKALPRLSVFHALNQKAVARRYAAEVGKPYEELNLVVAHMGGGVSVGAHRKGCVIDVNNALDGEGPIAPERAGSLPAGSLVELCFSGKYTKAEVKKMLCGKGGVVDLLGTNSMIEVRERAAAGDQEASLVLEAMCYSIAKNIGAMAAALDGKVDAVILTGGLAYSEVITDKIAHRISFIAPIEIYPGEDEMLALAESGLAVLRGEREAKIYE